MIEGLGITVRMYGVMIALGVYAGAFVVAKIAKKEELKEGVVWDGLWWVVIPAIVGARAYHVVDFWDYYSQYPDQIIALWRGGLGVVGAIVGGSMGVWWYWKRKLKVDGRKGGESKKKIQSGRVWKYLDLVSFGVPLGQAIGRWGNFFNQEIYGKPTNVPWAVRIEEINRVSGYEKFERFHPLFMYESLMNLLLFGVLVGLYWKGLDAGGKKQKGLEVGKGGYVGIYLLGYGVIRFLLEPWRLEMWRWGEIPVAQIFSAGMIGLGLWLLIRANRR